MQIDIGFGDIVYPAPEVTVYPTILDHSAPWLRGYARETAVAEKFEAMVKLGLLNSRMKDYYDIWLLSRQFDFEGATLASAIEKTFTNRKTMVIPRPSAFSHAFAADPIKSMQWQAFIRRSRLRDAPIDLASVVDAVAKFLEPAAASLSAGKSFRQIWHAPGPWTR